MINFTLGPFRKGFTEECNLNWALKAKKEFSRWMFQRVLVIGNIKKAWKLGRICICKNMYMFLEDMYRTCLYSGVEVGVVRDKEAGDKASYWWESWECGGRFCTKSTLHRSM